MNFDEVRAFALALPGVEDGTSYGRPALKVAGKLLTCLREDGDTLVLGGIEFDERDALIAAFPDTYYVTDHYRAYPSMLVRLSRADHAAVCGFVERRWRAAAPKRLLKAHDGR